MLRRLATSQLVRLSRAASAESELILERLSGEDKGIAVISFNRPKAMNSFSKNMVKCMREAIEGTTIWLQELSWIPSFRCQVRPRTPSCCCPKHLSQSFLHRCWFERTRWHDSRRSRTVRSHSPPNGTRFLWPSRSYYRRHRWLCPWRRTGICTQCWHEVFLVPHFKISKKNLLELHLLLPKWD